MALEGYVLIFPLVFFLYPPLLASPLASHGGIQSITNTTLQGLIWDLLLCYGQKTICITPGVFYLTLFNM